MGQLVWTIISAVLAVVGGIVLYCMFFTKKKEGTYTKPFMNWLYNFFTFKKLILEDLLKIMYLILTIFITLGSFASGFPYFLLVILAGNLTLRIVYEFALMMILICRNTSDINSKLSKKDVEETLDSTNPIK